TFEVEQGRGSECATTYRIWGETPRAEVSVDEVSEAKRVVARRRRELWVKGKQSDALVLRANFTGLSIESDEGQTDYEEGKGAFFVGEERVGTFESDGGVLNASLAGPSGVTTDYVVIAQPYRRQYSIQAASRDLLYAAV